MSHSRLLRKLADIWRNLKFVFALAPLLIGCAAAADTFEAKVVAVTDGDTIKVLDADFQTHVIRMLGIDAPEKKQPFGQQSRQHLADLVFGQNVIVEWHSKDRYKRILGKVWAESKSCHSCGMTLDVNLAQVATGYAWWYEQYAMNQTAADRVLYEKAEQQARIKSLMLWRDVSKIPPWEWRKGRRD